MASATPTDVHITVLGSPRIGIGSTEIDPSAELVFALALFLLLERGAPVSRRRLQTLLWPRSSDSIASHRLRQTLFKLRKLGFPLDPNGKACVVLRPVVITTDYELLVSSNTGCESALIEHSPFDGYAPGLSWEHSEWLDAKKTLIAATLVRYLLSRITKNRLEGNWHSVDRDARSLLAISPHNEEGTLALAESLAMRGDKIESVRILDAYLAEVGRGPSDLRIAATIMRRRIADLMAPRDHEVLKEIPLVGREQFIGLLAHSLHEVRHRKPKAVAIWGDAGIGKSRLLVEFLAFASLQGAFCQRISCRSSDAHRPLAVLLELLPSLRAMRGAIGSAPETLEFFAALTTHRPKPRTSLAPKKHSHLFSAGLHAAFADIIGAVTDDAPLVICVEDCQWLDAASGAVLASLTQKLTDQRLLLVFTSRVNYGGHLASRPFDAHTLELPPLDEPASEELFHSVVREHGRQVSPNYLRWCTAAAEGNPFFLREFANHWLETEDEHRSPPSLTAVLKQRLSRISSNAMQLLQTCAILENHASLDNVEAVLGYPAHELLHCINELSSSGMLAVTQPDVSTSGGARINSRHDLLSDVALMQLSAPARAFLHRRAAKVLEGLIQENGDASTLWSCAKHWQLAGDGSQAFRLATSCANHLLEAGLPNDAAEAFGRAQQYASGDEELLVILEGRASAFYRGSDWQNVTHTIAAARNLRSKLHPRSCEHDEFELMQLRADWQTLNWNDILARSLNCLGAESAVPTHRIEAGVMALMMLSFSNDQPRASTTFQTIVELSTNSNLDIGSLLQAKMVYHTHWGSFDEAVKATSELIAHDRESGDIGRVFRSLCNAAVTLRAAGMFDDAAGRLKEALSLAQRHHLYLSKARATPMLANLALERGRNDEAKQWLKELVSSPMAPDDRLGHDEVSAISARIALLEGRTHDAKSLIENELDHMRFDQVPQRRAYRAALCVAAELAASGVASSESLRELEAEYLLTRQNVFQAFASYSLYAGLISVGRTEAAEQLLNEYLCNHRREPWPAPTHLLDMMLDWIGEPRKLQTSLAAAT